MNNSITVLSETEDARLARNETRISQGLASFVEVGEALSDIRDARLYRATHGTFEGYCAEKWKMTKGRVYQLIGATEVMSTVVDKSQITTERQARELARVEPARREEVIRAADIATGGKITAAAIKQAAAPAKEIVVTVEPTMTVLHPLPPHVISAESLAAGDAADAESEKLWLLKSTWRKTNKKDRAAFIEWAQVQE
jgi:hypothetical protein